MIIFKSYSTLLYVLEGQAFTATWCFSLPRQQGNCMNLTREHTGAPLIQTVIAIFSQLIHPSPTNYVMPHPTTACTVICPPSLSHVPFPHATPQYSTIYCTSHHPKSIAFQLTFPFQRMSTNGEGQFEPPRLHPF